MLMDLRFLLKSPASLSLLRSSMIQFSWCSILMKSEDKIC